jgi:YD repeat-containing protein
VHYQYDADRLAAIEWTTESEPRLQAWRLVYEGPRLVQVRHELDGRVLFLIDYKYDQSGRRTEGVSVSTQSGYSTIYEFRYDPAGRLIGRDINARGERLPQQRIEYDAAGRVVRVIDREFETRYTYDDAGRLVRNEHLAKLPADQSQSDLSYSDGCTAQNTAGLVPDPVNYFLDDLLGLDDERWLRVHPEWDADVPWF